MPYSFVCEQSQFVLIQSSQEGTEFPYGRAAFCPCHEEMYLFYIYIIDNLREVSEFTKFAFQCLASFFISTPPNAPVSFVVNLLPLLSYSALTGFFSDFKMGLNPIPFSDTCYNTSEPQNIRISEWNETE